jgi:hypothetical protein
MGLGALAANGPCGQIAAIINAVFLSAFLPENVFRFAIEGGGPDRRRLIPKFPTLDVGKVSFGASVSAKNKANVALLSNRVLNRCVWINRDPEAPPGKLSCP